MIPQRIEKKINFTATCWHWTAAKSPAGYGVGYLNGRTGQAHRIVWSIFNGPIPAGMQLDHLCYVRDCVNPAHLEVVTPEENRRRIKNRTSGNAKKTHCPQGHPYTNDNLYQRPDGGRGCVACRREACARYEQTRVRDRRRAA